MTTSCTLSKSKELFKQAKEVLVGGVNSPVRAFKAIGTDPIFFKKGKGAYLYSEDNERYIDYVLSWGPLLLGHAHEEIIEAINEAACQGTSFGAPNYREIELALLIRDFLPSCEMIRFVNSGTEATMSALRLAKGITGKSKIAKFNGNYHGHSDSLLVKAGSGGLTLGIPDSLGIPKDLAATTLSCEFNDIPQLEELFNNHHSDLAAVIIEPISGNMGTVLGQPSFLKRLRELCTQYGTLLIFDEVMTGFRVHLRGAQAIYEIQPDLTCLGKVIGGGLPCGAYGGKKEYMRYLAPEGGVYQAGTLSGNPVVMAAGLAMLNCLKRQPEWFDYAENLTQRLTSGIRAIAQGYDQKITVNTVGTWFTVFFAEGPINNLTDAMKSNLTAFREAYKVLLSQGIYSAPSQFETNFLSCAHTYEDIDNTLQAYEKAFQHLRSL